MIDRALLKDNPDIVIQGLATKDPSFDVSTLIKLDGQVRHLRVEVETLRKKKNELAAQGKSGVTDSMREESARLSKLLKDKEHELETLEQEFKALYLTVPNLPAPDVPMGGKESNKVVKIVGTKKEFSFSVKNHTELAQKLGWIDFVTPVKLAGNNFILYKNEGVSMIYALAMLMLKNNVKHGYQMMLPPAVVNEQSLIVAGNFPKFKDDVYAIEKDGLYLIPTAEVSLANVYRDTILKNDELPIRMTAWTPCFRREAGGYGAQERGLIRIHQFEKVELFTLCEPQHSADEQDRMIACAESILKDLDLHYRISLLAGQDCSFSSAKTFDIEVWLPGQQSYYEVSSISNCTDFQARRGLIRYKSKTQDKAELVHTLNGSSFALSRIMVALIETYQQADGSVLIPDVLKKEGVWINAQS